MARLEPLLDPTGDAGRAAGTTLAPRLPTLRGLTGGLLENGRPNAPVLLGEVASELQRRYGVRAAIMHTKGYFGTPVEVRIGQPATGEGSHGHE